MTVLIPQETSTDFASETGAAPQASPGARCLPRHRLQTALADTHCPLLHDLHPSQFDNAPSTRAMENVRHERHLFWHHFAAARSCPPRLKARSVISSSFASESCSVYDSQIPFHTLFVFAGRNSNRQNHIIHDCPIPPARDRGGAHPVHIPLRSVIAITAIAVVLDTPILLSETKPLQRFFAPSPYRPVLTQSC
uniref:Uncharacterized protein n=1 Tax=Podospora anserina (strain S / ATCC MYA-4624 / DSM 980 / FGSC 10383) TaxID=515849 RepID=A0A090CP74_PODAN|nr:Putative protein of unknown function [Podospora anserina S mat+]